jgi:hypothetical protein
MASRFLMIVCEFKEEPQWSQLQEVLDKALDWVRCSPNCWLVWTSSSPEKWYTRFDRLLNKEGDHIFVCEVNAQERSGWMPKSFWQFIKSHL